MGHETRISLYRLKGWNQAVSSFGSTGFNLYSPTKGENVSGGEERGRVATYFFLVSEVAGEVYNVVLCFVCFVCFVLTDDQL